VNRAADDREKFNHGRARIAVAVRNDLVGGFVGPRGL
jgi:hypothetical protein